MVSAWEIKTMDVRKGRRAFQKKNFFIQSMRILFSVSFFMAGMRVRKHWIGPAFGSPVKKTAS